MSVEDRPGNNIEGTNIINTGEYNRYSRRLELSPQERALSAKTVEVFEKKVKRRQSWLIEPDGVITTIQTPRNSRLLQESDVVRIKQDKIIRLDDLDNETISDELAEVIRFSKFTEDYLPDFNRIYTSVARGYQGIALTASQWGVEEGQHGRLDGIILERSHGESGEKLSEDYLNQQETEFYAPFSTPIELISYAVLQEKITSKNYSAAAARAKEEGAPTVAECLLLIAGDEGWHGASYRHFYDLFAEYDPEAAKKAMLKVASSFNMPTDHLLTTRQKRQALIAARNVGFLVGDGLQQEIFKIVASVGNISKEEAYKAISSR